MKLAIVNMAPGTSDEEIKELVQKYAPELTCESIMREQGISSHPGAILELTGGTIASVETLSRRLSGMYWKEHELVCYEIGLMDPTERPKESG